MAWNNAIETKKFEAEQKKLAEEYRAAGMTEEQIKAMHEFDVEAQKSRRRYLMHNQQFPEAELEEDDESVSPLNDKFLDRLCVENDPSEGTSRFWWIDEISDTDLTDKLKKLSDEDKELLTLLVFDKCSQAECAKILGISQQAVSKRIIRFKKII